MCSCCAKAAPAPMDAHKALRSPVKMWISAAVDDSQVPGLPNAFSLSGISTVPRKQALDPATIHVTSNLPQVVAFCSCWKVKAGDEIHS